MNINSNQINEYQKMIQNFSGAPMKMLPDFIIGDVQIYLICGNLLHEKTDAIVHCTDAKFSCNGK